MPTNGRNVVDPNVFFQRGIVVLAWNICLFVCCCCWLWTCATIEGSLVILLFHKLDGAVYIFFGEDLRTKSTLGGELTYTNPITRQLRTMHVTLKCFQTVVRRIVSCVNFFVSFIFVRFVEYLFSPS